MQSRWLRTAAEFEKRSIDAKFKILVKFVKDKVEIANSSFALVVNQRNKRKGGSTFFANSDKPKVTPLNRNRADQKKCVYCKDDHKVEDCLKIANLSLSDRISFTRHNRMCDNCFKVGHISSFADLKPHARLKAVLVNIPRCSIENLLIAA